MLGRIPWAPAFLLAVGEVVGCLCALPRKVWGPRNLGFEGCQSMVIACVGRLRHQEGKAPPRSHVRLGTVSQIPGARIMDFIPMYAHLPRPRGLPPQRGGSAGAQPPRVLLPGSVDHRDLVLPGLTTPIPLGAPTPPGALLGSPPPPGPAGVDGAEEETNSAAWQTGSETSVSC